MNRLSRLILAALTALVLTLGASACGDDEEESGGGGGGSSNEVIKKDSANSGKTITVGSKNFAEQYILGEIYGQSLEAAGFKVKKELNLGSEQIAYKALKAGQIDGYPEYTGTALTSFYRVKTDDVPRDKDESFALLEEKLAADNITALPQTV